MSLNSEFLGEIDSELLSGFLDESETYLTHLNDELMALEESIAESDDSVGNEVDLEILNAMFRDAHSLKGLSAMLGFDDINHLTHKIENVFDAARNNSLVVTRQVVEVILESVDLLSELIEGLSSDAPGDSNAFESVALKLAQLLEPQESCEQTAGKTECSDFEEQIAAFQEIEDHSDIPEKYISFFLNEAEEAFAEVHAILEAGVDFNVSKLLATLHRIKGSAATIGLNRLSRVNHLLEDCVQNLGDSSGPPDEQFVATIQLVIDRQNDFVTSLNSDKPNSDCLVDAVRELVTCGATLEFSTDQVQPEHSQTPEALQDELEALQASPLTESDCLGDGEPVGAPDGDGKPVSEAVPVAAVDAKVASPKSPEKALPKAQKNPQAEESDEAKKKDRPIETIRVDIERLDHLMNQAGQLAINKARFARIGDQFKEFSVQKQTLHRFESAASLLEKMERTVGNGGRKSRKNQLDSDALQSDLQRLRTEIESIQTEMLQLSSMRALVNDLGESVHQLDRVAEGIQKSVMDTRMVPIGPLFSRFKRVVRDYVKESDKDIKLVIRGDKTELDKRMIDELGDPLIHMIRNSADHGIESPSERERYGKSKQGTITLDAFHRGNQVFVEVRDDGGGIDAEKVKQKAVSKGIITSDEADRMSDRQAFTLIWQPGFSTAEQVTEISGRGMGMDIVLSKLEKLNGTVEIDSELHHGTKITVKLPLTIAILPSLLTVISKSVFAVPVESVLEIVQVDDEQFSTVHGAQTAVIRGRVVSVIELHNVLKCNSVKREDESEKSKKTLVIVGDKGNELGLIVDDLLGEEDIVIKSLAENYENVKGFAGASILGDGRVSLILDVSEVIEMANRQGTGYAGSQTEETHAMA